VRIAEQTARVGDPVGGGTGEGGGSVLSYTDTSRSVTVELEVADSALAVKGRPARVTLPGPRTVKGTISKVGAAATAQPSSQGASSDQGAASEGASSAATTADAVIEVTVTIRNQKALGRLQAAPVDVDLVSATRKNVLAVPVDALLALPRGGFGVQVVDGASTRIVPVKTALFAAGQVEISGTGIAAGVRVGVPSD
jgi:hypothetical protein